MRLCLTILDGSWWEARGFTLTLALSHQGRRKVNEGGGEGKALPASFAILHPLPRWKRGQQAVPDFEAKL